MYMPTKTNYIEADHVRNRSLILYTVILLLQSLTLTAFTGTGTDLIFHSEMVTVEEVEDDAGAGSEGVHRRNVSPADSDGAEGAVAAQGQNNEEGEAQPPEVTL
jgi:hypothetical protein